MEINHDLSNVTSSFYQASFHVFNNIHLMRMVTIKERTTDLLDDFVKYVVMGREWGGRGDRDGEYM